MTQTEIKAIVNDLLDRVDEDFILAITNNKNLDDLTDTDVTYIASMVTEDVLKELTKRCEYLTGRCYVVNDATSLFNPALNAAMAVYEMLPLFKLTPEISPDEQRILERKILMSTLNERASLLIESAAFRFTLQQTKEYIRQLQNG